MNESDNSIDFPWSLCEQYSMLLGMLQLLHIVETNAYCGNCIFLMYKSAVSVLTLIRSQPVYILKVYHGQ